MLPVIGVVGALLMLPLPASAPHAGLPIIGYPLKMPFSGYLWNVRHSSVPTAPGPNLFVATNAYPDISGAMHLKVTPDPFGQWGAAQLDSDQSMGYGTYTWTIGTPLSDFDRNMVLGLFTSSPSATDSSREIDIEISRWGRTNEAKPAQFVVQPASAKGHLVRVNAPSSSSSTLQFVWQKGRVDFTMLDAGRVIERWTFKGSSVPEEGLNRVSMNLWLASGQPPSDNATFEVIIKKFSFCAIGATCG